MGFYESLSTWAGKPVVNFSAEEGITDPEGTGYRLFLEWEGKRTFTELFAQFLEDPRSSEVTSLVIGVWDSDEMYETDEINNVITALVGASEHLSRLIALFIGDVTSEECEISWIHQGDLSPVLGAFPQLQYLGVRGSQQLSLGVPQHPNLKHLVIESGGLPGTVVQEVGVADFPSLEHLELYLGTQGYGWDGSIDDLAPILAGSRWPRLTYLGLRDSEIADEIAKVLHGAPILERIQVLDLSLGTLGNEGAEALLANPAVRKLKKLDVHHHYISPEVVSRLEGLGIEVNASDAQKEQSYGRYVAVGE